MNSLQFGTYVLDPMSRELLRDGSAVALPGKAFDLLLFMAANPRRPLLKDELMSAVWPNTFVEEANLIQNVSLVRKALAPDGDRLIVTLPRKGYQFTAEVSAVKPDAVAAPAHALARPEAGSRLVYQEQTEERILIRRSPGLIMALVAGVALLVAVGWLLWQRWQDRVGGPPVQVVLADLEGSTGDPVLDRTLTNVLRMELTQSPFVSVVPAGTVRQTLVQMRHKPDDALTAQLALDLCERTASQAVLRGSVAHAGGSYVVTEEATNCVDGTAMGAARQEVSRAEDLPHALEKLGATLRHDLGESRRTLARFNQPLLPASTGSLEALKDFTEASHVAQSGRFPEAIELLKNAVKLDPEFATAYLNLSNFSANALDPAGSREYLQKAYQYRDQSTEPVRLFIAARYSAEITGDLYEALRIYRMWIDLYPRNPQAWSGVTQVYQDLGDNAGALAAALRTRELAPNNAVVHDAVAFNQIRTGDFAAARSTCQAALALGFDGEGRRNLLLRVAHLTHDGALLAEQTAWGVQHPDSPVLLSNEAAFAQSAGQTREAERLFGRLEAAFTHQGMPGAGTTIHQNMSVAYLALGEETLGRQLLGSRPVDPAAFNELLALGEAGEGATAAALLNKQMVDHPQSTLWTSDKGPLLRGALATQAGHSQEAIAELERTRSFDGRDTDNFYLRGLAYMQANQWPQAEAEFRALLAHPGIDPSSYQLPLAQLQLARVLGREGNRDAASAAYEAFLELWAHADADSPLLRQARSELATLKPLP